MSYTIINEYANVDRVCYNQQSGYCQVFYEPVEHFPIVLGSMSGIIYNSNQFELASFRFHREELVEIEHMNRDGVRLYGGRLRRDDGKLKLFFSEDLGEHYLCVSYVVPPMFGPKQVEPSKIKHNWLLEGF